MAAAAVSASALVGTYIHQPRFTARQIVFETYLQNTFNQGPDYARGLGQKLNADVPNCSKTINNTPCVLSRDDRVAMDLEFKGSIIPLPLPFPSHLDYCPNICTSKGR